MNTRKRRLAKARRASARKGRERTEALKSIDAYLRAIQEAQ
jgi:hypothetical protein